MTIPALLPEILQVTCGLKLSCTVVFLIKVMVLVVGKRPGFAVARTPCGLFTTDLWQIVQSVAVTHEVIG